MGKPELIGCALGGDAALVEATFEIGGDVGERGGCVDGNESRIAGEDFQHLSEVIGVIRAQVANPLVDEDARHEFGEALVGEAVAAVFALGPWVREIEMQRGGGTEGKQVFQEVGGFDPYQAQVGEAGAAGFAVEFAQASEEAFDGEEVSFRMCCGPARHEGAVAAAQFHFERERLGVVGVDGDAFDP